MTKKSKFLGSLIVFLSLLATSQSCRKESENTGETNNSSHNSSKSHNMGQNCMNCHKQGGSGEGWFNIAGSVYDSLKISTYPNATVNLYTGPNGTGSLKYTINADALGNFYTTGSIDFSGGLYPSVQGAGSTKYMSSVITTGQCNSCHGVTNDKIWVK
jgi:hypothetical protein